MSPKSRPERDLGVNKVSYFYKVNSSKIKELKEFLDSKVNAFNCTAFIEHDPISIPHLFTQKEDREISGFLTAIISWGQRPTILRNANWLMERMDYSPHAFIINHSAKDLKQFKTFVHRTFNHIDCVYFLKALQNIYLHHNGLENSFADIHAKHHSMETTISEWRNLFFSLKHETRTLKHISNPQKNSSAKRINMFLRWMVRNDKAGVDFGIWKRIAPSDLYAPLDLHSGRVARSLGLLTRKQDDWKAVSELTLNLRMLDPKDPIKYDFALYGLGIYEKFK